jgi:antitoxin VapB
MEPIVTLVGADERLLHYRNAVPTARRLKHHAMVTLCARRWGLVACITRAIHFGKLPDELRHKESVVAHVDAHYISATRPGRRLDMIFHDGAEAYQFYGFPGEWRHSTQGGQVGYMPREALASPQAHNVVAAGQAYAWSPSVAGVRSEDTILVGEDGNEVLTEIAGWPVIEIEGIKRPRILVV